jgi:hypothetical protein
MKEISQVWRHHGIYNVEILWKLTNKLNTKKININKLTHNLNKVLWTIVGKKRNKYITPNQVINDPFLSPNDYCKILNAELKYPIIIYDDDGDLDVLDGLHRLCKAYLLGYKTIKIKYVTMELLNKSKIIK